MKTLISSKSLQFFFLQAAEGRFFERCPFITQAGVAALYNICELRGLLGIVSDTLWGSTRFYVLHEHGCPNPYLL